MDAFVIGLLFRSWASFSVWLQSRMERQYTMLFPIVDFDHKAEEFS